MAPAAVLDRPVLTAARAERERQVAEAVHSGEMAGFYLGEGGRQDAHDYVDGLIDADELVARARARYGLD